jgi:hypothetical protein
MSMRIFSLVFIMISYVYSTQAQKVCRQNYKNETSLSYSDLMSFVLGSMSASYERTIYHKKGTDNFISAQLEYTNKIDLSGIDVSNYVATRFLTSSLKYNFGNKHIYSLGVGVIFSFLNITPIGSFSYKYDFRKYRFTLGGGLQFSYLGLARSELRYSSIPPIVITIPNWQYNYDYTWKDHILLNIRVGKYF